jgi:predicted RNase H-like nuclease (RuvC/YqgF family)
MRAENAAAFARIDRYFELGQAQHQALRADVTELRTDVTELRTDVTELRTHVTELRTEVTVLKRDVAALRNEFRQFRDWAAAQLNELRSAVALLTRRLDAMRS